MKEAIERLISHMIWADDRLASLIVDGADVSREVLSLLAHVTAAEQIWLARLRGESTVAMEVWPDLSAAESAAVLRENAAAYMQYVESAAESELETSVIYRNTSGKRFEMRKGDILLHVALHGAYHRGQIAKLIRQQGGQPVNTDYLAFVRETT